MKVGISDALSAKLKSLEEEKNRISQKLTAKPIQSQIKLPDIKNAFADIVQRLDEVMTKQQPEKARKVVHDIFGDIEIELRDREVWAKINTAQSLSYAIEPYLKVVAEAGFEPTTFGL